MRVKKDIYLPTGYVDIEKLLSYEMNHTIIIGGRGTGKTYGALKYILSHVKVPRKFILLRRSTEECETITMETLSPFKALIDDGLCPPISTEKVSKSVYSIHKLNNMGKETIPIDIGYAGALTTFANVRGFSGNDVDILLYDEFIPETHKKRIKGEAFAFFNIYETVNRNRELKGQPPLKTLLLSNSEMLANPIFIELQLVNEVYKMYDERCNFMIIPERSLLVAYLFDSPISEKKAETSLYKLTNGSSFNRMALDNEFFKENYQKPVSRNLKEYVPIVQVSEITLYDHKSKREIYVSPHKSGTCPVYNGADEKSLIRFQRKYDWMYLSYLEDVMKFETVMCEVLFRQFIGRF